MKKFPLIALMFVALFASTVRADVPDSLSYQGVLTDALGVAVDDGDYNITFRLYTVASGGTHIWEEIQTVTVIKGIFDVILGSSSPLSVLAFDSQYYLGISVEGEAELTPRIPLTASAYSLNSKAVNGKTNVFPSEGNVGIGTASPAEKLDVNGTTRVGGFVMPTGASDGYILTTNGLGTGTWQAAQPDNDWTVSGNDMYSILPGNVGIGTASPAEKLHVNGTARVGGFVMPTGASNGYVLTTNGTGTASWQPSGAGTPDNDWTVSGSNMYSIVSGNVGVGTTSPAEKLDVNGTARVSGFVMPTGASDGYILTTDGSGTGAWQAAQPDNDWTVSGSDIYSNVSGNVGIGTSAPSTKLEVQYTNTLANNAAITIDNDAVGGQDVIDFKFNDVAESRIRQADGGDFFAGTVVNNAVNLITNDTSRVRVTGAGDVGIGVGSPQAKLHVEGDVDIGSAAQTGRLDLYLAGSIDPVMSAYTNARGCLFYCYDEAGNPTGTIQPDGHGTGGYFYLRRSETSTGFRIDGNYGGTEEPRVEITGSTNLAAFRMYESADATVILPTDAISPAEILGECGVASYEEGISNVALGATLTTLGSQSIVTPAAGYIFVIATGQAEIDHSNGTTSSFTFGISDLSDALPDNQDILLRLNGGLPSGYYDMPVTVHGLFEASAAGTYTFYFLGSESSGSCTCFDVQFTLAFIPTSYGTVEPTLASGQAADTDNSVKPALSAGDVAAQRIASEAANLVRIERELERMRVEIEALKNEKENEQ